MRQASPDVNPLFPMVSCTIEPSFVLYPLCDAILSTFFKIITQDVAPIGIVGCRDGVIRTSIEGPSSLPQTHKRFCNASCWSFWPLATTDADLPDEVIYICIIGPIEGRVTCVCRLLASLHKNNKARFQASESPHTTDCKIASSDQMTRC